MQYRVLCRNHQVGIVRKDDNSINGDLVAENKPQKRLYVAFVLPDGISQLMFLGKAEAFIAYVRQVLFPEFGITASIHSPVNILRLQHKHAITRNDDMIYLRGVLPIPNEKIIENTVVLTVQILQE